MMKKTAAILTLLAGMLTAQQVYADEVKVASLMTKPVTNIPGQEGLMLLVEYPPGASDPVHRHNADAFLYILEGSVVMQVEGGEPVTLVAGQTFHEGANDIHTVGRNASKTKPAKFVVVLVKDRGAPALIPQK